MSVDEDPVAAFARSRFGIDYLLPYQRLVVANILDSSEKDAEPLKQIILLPTGFGKSLCFQLPALLLTRPTVVVYPLLALMEDQRRRLESMGIRCAVFRGGQTALERESAETQVESGEARIIITNPECLSSARVMNFLRRVKPCHIAIDEAHCVSEWGETFRPSYLELGSILEDLSPPALSAFTATASPAVLEALSRIIFRGSSFRVIEGNPDRPNIHYSVALTLCKEHSLERLARSMPRPLIVFCSSREGTRITARMLSERLGEREIRFYHAGLERSEKKRIEEWFFSSDEGILVSTCAYGMGVDKKNIRSVIHADIPPSVEAYLQEAGRAGRDGLPSRAVLIHVPGEGRLRPLEADPLRRGRFQALVDYAESSEGCRREQLLALLGVPAEKRSVCSGCDRCDSFDDSYRRDSFDNSDRREHEEICDDNHTVRSHHAGQRGFTTCIEGAAELVEFVRANDRRFSADEAVELLIGGSRVRIPRCACWSSFAGWDRIDISRALDTARSLGLVREYSKWPWKGRIGTAISSAAPGRPHCRLFFSSAACGLAFLNRLGGLCLRRRRARLRRAKHGTADTWTGSTVVDHADIAQYSPCEYRHAGDEDDAPIRKNVSEEGKVLGQAH
jgi:ATP-dependent DNA helicase RecQ